MQNKMYALPVVLIFFLIAWAMAWRPPVVMAQATSTFTPTATVTPYPFPTATPGPTTTPGPTATPLVFTQHNYSPGGTLGSMGLGSSIPDDPSARLKTELQGAIDVTNDISDTFDLMAVSMDTRTNNYVLIIKTTSPFAVVRGALVLFSDFEWLGILGVWFIIAGIVIAAITVIRLIISLWGVVERLISIIKLIPFI